MPGSSSWMPYAPQGVKGFDDDDDDDVYVASVLLIKSAIGQTLHRTFCFNA